ncbi:MAG TPA: site-2 protease family protein [Candidatus Paceibacterota bacterium]
MSAILSLIILILSVVVHEVAHGYAAKWEGDNTASNLGRLSGNPLRHIDPFGSVILPTLTYLLGGFVIGWAKPVPIDPRSFRHQRWGEGLVAAVGPATNILLAIIFAFIVRNASLGEGASLVAQSIVFINIILALFNLIPVPPLDGSRILSSIFPSIRGFFYGIERYGIFLPIIFALIIWQFFFSLIHMIFRFLTGVAI